MQTAELFKAFEAIATGCDAEDVLVAAACIAANALNEQSLSDADAEESVNRLTDLILDKFREMNPKR